MIKGGTDGSQKALFRKLMFALSDSFVMTRPKMNME